MSKYKSVVVEGNEAKMNALIKETSICSEQIEASETFGFSKVVYWISATLEQFNELKEKGYSVEKY